MVQDFEAKLNEYARLLVEVGMNVQPGQTPRINAPLDAAPLARLCAAACYDRGARDVVVDWRDDFVSRQRYLRADEGVFSEFPSYQKAKFDWLLEHGCPNLSLTGSDPELLRGVDPARIQAADLAAGEPTKPFYDAMTAGKFQWCVGSFPSLAWAEKAFPDRQGADAVDALWDAIFSVCRITGDGKAVGRWREHVAATARRARALNEYQFASLRYANSLGTDLTARLPENHVWAGGSEKSAAGVEFVANMPTEEIFTTPHRDRADGVVHSALPLNYKTCTEDLGVDEAIASFVLPLGMTINMNGTAIMQVIATVFIAGCAGYPLSLTQLVVIAVLALIASAGTPAAPGAGAIVLFTILSGVGFVNEGALLAYSLILAINRPIEMLVTALNVVGDAVTSIIVAKSEGVLDGGKYDGGVRHG